MTPISGAIIADEIKGRLREQNLLEDIKPLLAVILVGEQPDSAIYVSLKEKSVNYISGRFRLEKLGDGCSKAELLALIHTLNQDADVDGIILQLPLPDALEPHRDEFLAAISPTKDVDGFHPQNRGMLLGGEPHFISCAALACMEVMRRYITFQKGPRVNLIGNSFDLIMPLALLLLKENCRVALFPDFSFDGLVNCDAAVIEKGGPAAVRQIPDDGPGLLIDAGFYFTDDGSVGNVSPTDLENYPGRLLPVPGGLGPVLIAKLMENLNLAARRRK